jgi:hypothetical protein
MKSTNFFILIFFSHINLINVTDKRVIPFTLARLDCTVAQYPPHGLSHAVVVAPAYIRCDWPAKMPAALFLLSLSFLLLPPPLSLCGGSIGNFEFLFANRIPWCHKSII